MPMRSYRLYQPGGLHDDRATTDPHLEPDAATVLLQPDMTPD
jgi:hypothetical protein